LLAKVEEYKSLVRVLEEENMRLKFQISAMKEQEKEYMLQIQEARTLSKKFYNKAKSIHNPSSSRNGSTNTTLTEEKEIKIENKMNSDSHIPQGKPLFRRSSLSHYNSLPRSSTEKRLTELNPGTKKLKPQEVLDFDEAESIVAHEFDSSKHPVLKKSIKFEKPVVRDLDAGGEVTDEGPISSSPPMSLARGSVRKIQSSNATIVDGPSSRPSIQDLECIYSINCLIGKDKNKFQSLSDNIVSLAFKPLLSEEAEKEVLPQNETLFTEVEGRKSTIKYIKTTRYSDSSKKTQIQAIQEKKLFEDFFVIGIEKDDLKKFIKENPE